MSFWGECILTATFLINRTPSPLLHNNNPYTVLYEKPFDYPFFKVFGCLCFASTLISTRNKFSPIATMCVFVSHSPEFKGYKVYDITSRHFFYSRDVVFHVTIFPFHTVSLHSIGELDLFHDLVLPSPSLDIVSSPELSFPNSHAFTPLITTTSLPLSNDHLHHSTTISHHAPLPRRSIGNTKLPCLRDFHCNLLSNYSIPLLYSAYPITDSLSYTSF